jgi:hypothetical protein
VKEKLSIIDKANALSLLGLRDKDSLHISCAISAKCDHFLTTDDHILNKGKLIEELVIEDPISFIKEVYS